MRTHTTLVNPPYPQGAHQHPPFIPLGLGYLAAVLEKNQYQVDVVDYQALKLTHEQFKAEIRKRQSDIVGVTSTTLTYKSALQIALHSGEDYQLLFTMKSNMPDAVINSILEKTGIAITEIGKILTKESGYYLIDSQNNRVPIQPKGWDHFR